MANIVMDRKPGASSHRRGDTVRALGRSVNSLAPSRRRCPLAAFCEETRQSTRHTSAGFEGQRWILCWHQYPPAPEVLQPLLHGLVILFFGGRRLPLRFLIHTVWPGY